MISPKSLLDEDKKEHMFLFFGPSWAVLGRLAAAARRLGGGRKTPWGRLRAVLGRLAAAARPLGGVFGPSWAVLIFLAAAARRLGGVFGPSWAVFGLVESNPKTRGHICQPRVTNVTRAFFLFPKIIHKKCL